MRTPKILSMLALLFALVAAAGAFNLDPIIGSGSVITAFAFIAGSLKSSKELRDLKAETFEKAQGIVNAAKGEKRNMNEDELKRYNEYLADMKLIDDEIRSAEEFEKRTLEMAGNVRNKENEEREEKEVKKYSLMRAIRGQMSGKLDGFEREMHEEAEKEMRESGGTIDGLGVPTMAIRAMTATGTTSTSGDQGGMTIQTDKYSLIDALRPKLVLSSLGTQMWGGLVGNVDIPKGTSATAAWATENADATETSPTTSLLQLSPKRLAAFSVLSKQLSVQTSFSVDQWLINNILAAIAQAVEEVAIAGGGSNEPEGILETTGIGSVVGGASGADPTWDHIVNLENKVDVSNALMGSLAYLTNSKVKGKLKKTKLDSGSGLFVWPQGENQLNGYAAGITNLVPSDLEKVENGTTHENLSAIIFGNFNELIIGQWGALDLTVDPYSLSKKNQIQIVANSLWDVAVRYPEAFAAMLDAKTA